MLQGRTEKETDMYIERRGEEMRLGERKGEEMR